MQQDFQLREVFNLAVVNQLAHKIARIYYQGQHLLEIQINGTIYARQAFELT